MYPENHKSEMDASNQIVIHTLSSPVGGGKTFSAIRHAARHASAGRRVCIVQPSKTLLSQTYADLVEHDPSIRVTMIHGDDGQEGSTVKRIVKHLRETKSGGEVLLITHSAFMRLEHFYNAQSWSLIWDEAPQIDYYRQFNLAENPHVILDLFETEPYNSEYSTLVAKDNGTLSSIAKNILSDEVWKGLEEFAGKFNNPNWTMYVRSDQYEAFSQNSAKAGSIIIYGLLSPTIFHGFANVTMMGACLEETMAYRYWSQDSNVKFIRHPLLKPRFVVPPNSHLIDIYYANQRDWSKTLRDKIVTVDDLSMTMLESVVARSLAVIGDERHVWLGNKDLDDPFCGRGEQLPNSPHGINSYQHHNNVVCLSALLPAPAHFSFLHQVAMVNPDEAKDAGYRQAVLQAAGRISIRDLANTERKRVIVTDEATALWLARQYQGASVQQLPGENCVPETRRIGRPKTHESEAKRVAGYKKERKARLIDGLDEANESLISGTETTYTKVISVPYGRHHGSIFESKTSAISVSNINELSQMDFIQFLQTQFAEQITDKQDNWLISPAIYNPDMPGVDTKRGLANITSLSGVWLDNDGGGISHEQFAAMYPRLEVIAYNTHSSTVNDPRWRCYIPTTHLLTVDAYAAVISEIKEGLRMRGWYEKAYCEKNTSKVSSGKARDHGFDASKFTPAAMFYLPGTNPAQPDAAFFVHYQGKHRRPLNPYQWIDKTIIDHRPELAPASAQKAAQAPSGPTLTPTMSPALKVLRERLWARHQEARLTHQKNQVEAAIDEWQSVGWQSGHGNDPFKFLALKLWHAGMDVAEMQSTLWHQASHAASPKDRRDQIKTLIKWCQLKTPR